MAFTDFARPTAFAIFDAEAAFQTEADNMIRFVKTKLGDDILSVELSSKSIYCAFEEATLLFRIASIRLVFP